MHRLTTSLTVFLLVALYFILGMKSILHAAPCRNVAYDQPTYFTNILCTIHYRLPSTSLVTYCFILSLYSLIATISIRSKLTDGLSLEFKTTASAASITASSTLNILPERIHSISVIPSGMLFKRSSATII